MPMFIFFRILSLCVENLRFLLVKSLESIVLSQLVSNPGVRVWERGKQESAPAGQPGCSKKGRTPPLDLEGLEFARFGVRQSIYETAGNFCTSDNGKKGGKRKKRGFQPEKSGGSPAAADSAAVYWLDIYGKNVCRILSPKARKPA